MKSIFSDKSIQPDAEALKKALGKTYDFWMEVLTFTKELYPEGREEWNFSGEKYGWSFRISDKKRVLVYLLPRDKYFKVALVFGQKATDAILKSSISDDVKAELKNAKVYAEGRGVRIDIVNKSVVKEIKELIRIKISVS